MNAFMVTPLGSVLSYHDFSVWTEKQLQTFIWFWDMNHPFYAVFITFLAGAFLATRRVLIKR